MESERFKINIECNNCKSNNIRFIKDMDFRMGDHTEPTGDILLKCIDCKTIEKIILKYEMIW